MVALQDFLEMSLLGTVVLHSSECSFADAIKVIQK